MLRANIKSLLLENVNKISLSLILSNYILLNFNHFFYLPRSSPSVYPHIHKSRSLPPRSLLPPFPSHYVHICTRLRQHSAYHSNTGPTRDSNTQARRRSSHRFLPCFRRYGGTHRFPILVGTGTSCCTFRTCRREQIR